MSNVPPCIAVVQKWNKDKHGIDSTDEKYINYLSTKYLLCWDTHYYDSDTDDEYAARYLDGYSPEIQLNEALSFVGIRAVNIQDWEIVYRNEIPCVIKKTYVYRDRTFCIRNYGIELFQKLWRDFHYIKMARYKAIKNLQYRQIYGKF
tara:strand:- start:231 stop:674 length:444 start_codon:yes stop_codon:yes gene_type:complete